MRAWQVEGAFGLENLVTTERSTPAATGSRVVMKVDAASLNFRDLLMVKGLYNPRQPLPLIPLSDGAGTLVEVGPDVKDLAVGERVCTLFAQGWDCGPLRPETRKYTLGGPLDGTLAQYVELDASGVIPHPQHLNAAEASTLPCAALTAWSALFVHGDLKADDTVLLLGTGGVSIFALQFAVALGARVIITSSCDQKLERATMLGATHTINYRQTPEWGRKVRELTDGTGADLVVEVGGAGTFAQSLRAVRTQGTIALIGVLAGGRSQLDLTPVLMNQVRVQGVFVGHRQSFAMMNRFIEEHAMTPSLDRSFSFSEAPAAFEYAGRGEHVGKITIEELH